MKLFKKIHLGIFSVLMLTMYSLLMLEDFKVFKELIDSNILRYIIVIFVNINNLGSLFLYKDKIKLFIRLGIFMILVADYFLIFNGDELGTIGILFYMLVQLLFNIYEFKSLKSTFLVVLGGLFAFLMILFFYKEEYVLLYSMAGSYFTLQVLNAILYFINFKKLKNKYLFIIGLILLMLCDLSIGLSKITDISIFSNLIWLFYVPSLYFFYLESVKENV